MPLAQIASNQTVQLLMNNQLRKIRKDAVLTSLEARSEGSLQKAEQTAKILNQNCQYPSQHSKPQTPEGDDKHEARTVR
jgi:predicted KAP-like P-loop ATPase